MRISDWSSDVCSSDLLTRREQLRVMEQWADACLQNGLFVAVNRFDGNDVPPVNEDSMHPTIRLVVAADLTDAQIESAALRSEERRVGKECVSTCRSRWALYNKKKKSQTKQILK